MIDSYFGLSRSEDFWRVGDRKFVADLNMVYSPVSVLADTDCSAALSDCCGPSVVLMSSYEE